MPIEIVVPGVGQLPFGPGASLQIRDTDVGPFPIDDSVTVDLYVIGTEQRLGQAGSIDTQAHDWFGNWATPTRTGFAWNYMEDGSNLAIDQPLRLIARRTHANGQIVSEDQIEVKWAPTQFVWFQEFWQLFLGGSGQGGFTANDRAEAEVTQAAVQMEFPRQIGALPDLILGLGDLVEHIGVQLVVPGEEILISGRGSLERPGGPIAINAYGLTWRFATLTPGLGFRDGAVATFYDRILQLVRVDVDRDSNEYLGEVFDIRTEGGRIVWGFGIPRRLLYDVLPGCVVGVRWLLL